MRKNTRVEKSSDEFHDIAETTLTEHDAAWSLRGERDEMVIIREILTKRWWSSVPVNSFYDELLRVIPTFQPLGLRGEIKTKILKKGNKIDLGAYLVRIKELAKSEEKNNDIDDEDVSDKSEDYILRKFIKFGESQHHSNSASKKEEEKEKIQKIFDYFSTDLSKRARFTTERTYIQHKEASLEDEGGDNGDEDDNEIGDEEDEDYID